jgi:hypothetical protein
VNRPHTVHNEAFHSSSTITSQRVHTSTKNATVAKNDKFGTDPEARLLLTRTMETLQKLYWAQAEMTFAPPAFCDSDELGPFKAVPLLGV